MSDERPRLRHGEKEYELLPPEARHAWLDPDADPALAPPPAAEPGASAPAPAPARTSTRRTIVVSCIAAFVAGIATFAVVRAVRDDDGPRRERAAPATSAPARPTTPTTTPATTPTTRPRTTTTAPAANRPSTSTPATSTPATSAAPAAGSRVVLGVTVSEGTDGVTIVSIASGSGADAAGLRPGDVFVSLDGAPIGTTDDLGAAIGTHRAGDRVSVVVRRGGADVTVSAILGTTTA